MGKHGSTIRQGRSRHASSSAVGQERMVVRRGGCIIMDAVGGWISEQRQSIC
jgi:hypothetical protein